MADRINQQIALKDGRSLGYAEYGAPEGKPIIPLDYGLNYHIQHFTAS